MLAAESFDAVVLDLRMPKMDGRAVLAALRRRDAVTPVIVLTGQAEVHLAAEVLREGATDVLTKPCPVDVLWAAIEDARERKAAAAPTPPETPGER
jgi:two-component system response regulator TctD